MFSYEKLEFVYTLELTSFAMVMFYRMLQLTIFLAKKCKSTEFHWCMILKCAIFILAPGFLFSSEQCPQFEKIHLEHV